VLFVEADKSQTIIVDNETHFNHNLIASLNREY